MWRLQTSSTSATSALLSAARTKISQSLVLNFPSNVRFARTRSGRRPTIDPSPAFSNDNKGKGKGDVISQIMSGFDDGPNLDILRGDEGKSAALEELNKLEALFENQNTSKVEGENASRVESSLVDGNWSAYKALDKVLMGVSASQNAVQTLAEDYDKRIIKEDAENEETEASQSTKDSEDDSEYVKHSASTVFGRKYIGTVQLPSDLERAVDMLLQGVSRRQLKNNYALIEGNLRQKVALPKGKIVYIKGRQEDLRGKLDSEETDGLKMTEKSVESTSGKRIQKRANHNFITKIDYSKSDVTMAYLAARMPATYSATFNVLNEIRNRFPGWSPRRVLDFGTGTGAAIWAAREVWGNEITKFVGIDTSSAMLKTSEFLFNTLPEDDRATLQLNGKIRFGMAREMDLVVSSFGLEDVSSARERQEILLNLWSQTNEMLVLVERGTPEGFNIITEARDFILRENKRVSPEDVEQFTARHQPGLGHSPAHGVHIVAPCPHDGICPLAGGPNICRFSQRLQLPAIARTVKDVKDNAEASWYTYLVLRKGLRPKKPINTIGSDNASSQFVGEAYSWPRLVFPPIKGKSNVIMDVCAGSGNIERMHIARSDGKQEYTDARKSNWGDLFPALEGVKGIVRDPGQILYKAGTRQKKNIK